MDGWMGWMGWISGRNGGNGGMEKTWSLAEPHRSCMTWGESRKGSGGVLGAITRRDWGVPRQDVDAKRLSVCRGPVPVRSLLARGIKCL